MTLSTRLKIGNVNNLSDARFAAGIGAEFIGFCFELNNPNYINPEKATAISGWLEGPQFVGEFDIQDAEEINTISHLMQLPFVQLRQHHNKLFHEKLNSKVIQMVFLDQFTNAEETEFYLQRQAGSVELFLLSFENGKAVQDKFLENEANQNWLKQVTEKYPAFLNFHFTRENIRSFLAELQPSGINLNGEPEIKPGYRDFDELIDLVELLENAG